MKSPIVLITVVVVLAICAFSREVAQAAEPSAGHSAKLSAASVVPGGGRSTTLSIKVGTNQTFPVDPNVGREWALKVILAFVGLGAGSITLNYMWMQNSTSNR